MKYKFITTLLFFFGTILNFCVAQTTYPSGVNGCIARWDFANNGTVTSVPDISLNGNNGAPYNIATAVAFRTITNKAMKFNGASSRAMVANAAMLSPNAMTIIALVNLDGFYSGHCEVSHIVSKGYPHFVSGNYGLGFGDNIFDGACGVYSPNNMQMTAQFNNAGGSPVPGNYVQTGKWYFCAVSYNGNTVKYYQKEMDTAVYYSTILPFHTQSGMSAPIGVNNQELSIGYHMNPIYPYWFNGRMDELVLFNHVLTDAQVQSVYEYLWGRLTCSTNDTILCNSNQFTVNYITYNPDHYQPGNIFTAQLSDASGSFASPVNIGSVASIVSGSINCTIPIGTPAGNGYRVRVVASNVPFISQDNGINIVYNSPITNVNIGNDTAICGGMPLTLSAGNFGVGTSYLWSNGATGSSTTVSTPGIYWVTVTVSGCTGSDTINIGQATTLPVSLGSDVAICPGQSATISPSVLPGGATYTWSTGSTSSSITVSTTGTYWVTINAGGCIGSDTINIVPADPIPVNLGNDVDICPGQSTTLSPSVLPPGATYTWNTGSNSSSITVSSPGTYWVTIDVGGCTGSDTINIGQASALAVNLGNDMDICEGQSATISPLALPGGTTYLWSTGSTSSSVTVSSPGTYWLFADFAGCAGSDTITITQTPLPDAFPGNDTIICDGHTVILSAPQQPAGATYVWNTGSTDPQITIAGPGTYSLTVTTNGCSSTGSLEVTPMSAPVIYFGNDTMICSGIEMKLPKYVTGSYTYTLAWQDGSTNNFFQVKSPGVYMATASNICGSSSDTINVQYQECDFWFPTGFTPEGNNLNEKARLKGPLTNVADFEMKIFNRFGNCVFATNDKYAGWDGTFKGKAQPIGAYYYYIRFKFNGKGHFMKGDITLLR